MYRYIEVDSSCLFVILALCLLLNNAISSAFFVLISLVGYTLLRTKRLNIQKAITNSGLIMLSLVAVLKILNTANAMILSISLGLVTLIINLWIEEGKVCKVIAKRLHLYASVALLCFPFFSALALLMPYQLFYFFNVTSSEWTIRITSIVFIAYLFLPIVLMQLNYAKLLGYKKLKMNLSVHK